MSLKTAIRRLAKFGRRPEVNSGVSLTTTTRLNLSQTDRMRQIIRHEMFMQAIDKEKETFKEADDFDLEDGTEWVSPYEDVFEPLDPDPKPAALAADPAVKAGGENEPPVNEPQA